MLAASRRRLKNVYFIFILSFQVVVFCEQCLAKPYTWRENAFAQQVAKLVISDSGKTHILAACWNAQLRSGKSQPVQKLSLLSFLLLFDFELGNCILFVCCFPYKITNL